MLEKNRTEMLKKTQLWPVFATVFINQYFSKKTLCKIATDHREEALPSKLEQ